MIYLPTVLFTLLINVIASISPNYNDQLMYNIIWKGPQVQQESDKLNSKQESVVLLTKENEKYKCLLPMIEDDSQKSADSKSGPTPEQLMADTLTQGSAKKCSLRLEPYWTYEICHGEIIKQYHEEKKDDGIVAVTEYVLGRLSKLEVKEILTSAELNINKKISTRRINNRETPYYSVVMGNGTPCDLSNDKPRLTTVFYICHPSSHSEILSIKEVTTCEYELIVLTPTLCANPLYLVKTKPVHSIQCHSLDGAPWSPFQQDRINYMNDIVHHNVQQPKVTESPKPVAKPKIIDPVINEQFLKGLYCLIGGAGWWQYELCHGRFIHQFHQEPRKKNIVIKLGVWNKQKHIEWAKKNQKKVKTGRYVTHFYTGGDVCDLNGQPRISYVRLLCKEGGGQQIAIHMTEENICQYTVVVESAILCPLIAQADQYGLFPNEKNKGEL